MFEKLKTITTFVLVSTALAACAQTEVAPKTSMLTKQERQAFNQSISHFEKMLVEKPNEIEAVIGLARNLRWAERAPEAAQLLKKYQKMFANNGRYLAELGKVNLILGQSKKGVNLITQATQHINDDWRLYSALGIGLDYQGEYVKAETAYNKALKMCPDDSAVINNLGVSQGLSGRLDLSILTLQHALTYGVHSEKIKRNLALFKGARDLCSNCDGSYLKGSDGMILAAGLKSTDKEGPCTAVPEYTAKAPVMVKQLATKTEIPSINIKVYFEFDSAILKPQTLEVLNNLGAALTFGELNEYRFQIAGHTDAVGSERYNQTLSERRAKAVLDYLTTNFSIEANRIDAIGYGEGHLLDPSNPEGDVNRRVQVTRLDKMP